MIEKKKYSAGEREGYEDLLELNIKINQMQESYAEYVQNSNDLIRSLEGKIKSLRFQLASAHVMNYKE